MTYTDKPLWKPKTNWLDEQIALKKQQLTEGVQTTPSTTPSWRDVQTASVVEKPKALWEATEQKMAEGISKVPILPKVLEPVGKAFEWVGEKIEKPFAAIITSPFSPTLEWKQGESWIEHQKREYDAWDAPTYVKGAAEFATPIWWIPWFGWAAKGAKALGVGGKVATTLAKTGKFAKVSEYGLPSGKLLDQTLFKSGISDKFLRWTENVPVLKNVVKTVGGEKAFTDPTSQLPIQVTRRALVKYGFVNDMRGGIKSLLVPKLQVKGDIKKILGMDRKGVVSNVVDNSGKSQYLYDVLEGAVKNKEGYKFLSKEAESYVDTLSDVLQDVYTLARKEGVKVPKATILHRIVKGKTVGGEYVATEYGSKFELQRTHKLMKEGVETGVDYGLDINESISATVDHYVKEIAKRRFTKEVKTLGRTAKQMWDETPEGIELAKLKASEIEGVLNQPERLAELIDMKSKFLTHFKGRDIFPQMSGQSPMAKFYMRPEFGNAIFPKNVVKTAERVLNDNGQKWLDAAANVSGVSRTLTAAIDLSAPFIQGAAVFGRNPVAWAGGVLKMLNFVVKPDDYIKYLTSPRMTATRMERIMAGGSSQTFEYFKALAPMQRVAEKIPKAGKAINKIIGQTFGRAETAFTGFGEASRNYLWEALSPSMRDATGKIVADKATDLARSIDRMTGVMSTEALAIGRTQQDFENAFVFFAPRYTRAGLTLVSDMLRGGMAGAEARKAIGAMAASGLTFYYGACKALGQTPNFDPSSGKFMTIKVGDSHIGVGGIMTALTRLGYDLAITAAQNPEDLIIPIKEGRLNRWDNPFIKFLYSRTSPLTSTAYSLAIENTNYFGEPFEDAGDWGKFMLDKITPIALQNVMRDPQVDVAIAEFGGLRAFPKSPWELLDEERDRVSISEHGQPYDNLNDLNKMQVNKKDTVIKLQKDVDASTVTRGDVESVAFLNRQREQDSARQTYEETLWNYQNAYDAGKITGSDFREKMQEAGYGLGVTYNHIDSQPEYAPVLKMFEKPKNLTDKTVGDVAYNELMTALYKNNEFTDQYGLFKYDEYNQFIDNIKKKYGQEVYQYILDRKAEKDENLPPLAKQYNQAKEILKPYWAVQQQIEKRFGRKLEQMPEGMRRNAERLITQMRKLLRARNKDIAEAYQTFYASGY